MRWMWIDSIVDFEPEQRLAAIKNVSLAEEHLHDHFAAETARDGTPLAPQPIMPGCFILEGMAQTAGILVGSVNRFREKVILAKIGAAELAADARPGDTIRYEATIDRIDAAGALTSGTVQVRRAGAEDWEPAGAIDLMFSHLDQNMSGLEFPEENFVFSDNFRTVLRAAGLEALAADDE